MKLLGISVNKYGFAGMRMGLIVAQLLGFASTLPNLSDTN